MRLIPGGSHFMSYGYNVWGSFTSQVPNTGLGGYKGDPIYGSAKESQVRKPTDMIALGDSNWDVTRKGDPNWSGFIGMYAERQWPLDLHNGRANLAYCDGHVQSARRAEFVSQLNENPREARANMLWNRDHKVHW